MLAKDWDRFVKSMTRLGVAVDQVQSNERVKIYWDALRTTRIEALEWACLEAEKRFVWFPKVPELRDLAGLVPVDLLPALPIKKAPQLEVLEQPEVIRGRLQAVADTLNGRYGTSFKVTEDDGRPALVPCARA